MIILFDLSGCTNTTTTGVFPENHQLKQIQLHKSNKTEIKKILGMPKKVILESEKSEKWIYTTTESQYTDAYAAKKALSFAPVPFLGTVLGAVDTGPSQTGTIYTLSLYFNKRGILQNIKREIEYF